MLPMPGSTIRKGSCMDMATLEGKVFVAVFAVKDIMPLHHDFFRLNLLCFDMNSNLQVIAQ